MLYDAHEKPFSNMTEKKSMKDWKNNLLQEIRTISDLIKKSKGNTRNLESLTVNQDLVEEKLNTLRGQLKVV